MTPPKVSIAVLTFNHERFLKKTLNSFLMQDTNFDFEVIIGDDASTDKTPELLKSFEQKHPNRFKITYHKDNIGMLPNFISTLNACNGTYIAFCEGDDYWTDPFKLQKQVDFLDHNSEYAICFHNVMVYHEKTQSLKEDDITLNEKNDYNLSDLVKGNFMHTPTVMLRNDYELSDWFNESPIGDWPFYLNQLKDRKIKKLDDKMAVYRVHQNSAWSSKSSLFRIERTINTIELVLENIDFPESHRNTLIAQKEALTEQYNKKNKSSLYKKIKTFLRRS